MSEKWLLLGRVQRQDLSERGRVREGGERLQRKDEEGKSGGTVVRKLQFFRPNDTVYILPNFSIKLLSYKYKLFIFKLIGQFTSGPSNKPIFLVPETRPKIVGFVKYGPNRKVRLP